MYNFKPGQRVLVEARVKDAADSSDPCFVFEREWRLYLDRATAHPIPAPVSIRRQIYADYDDVVVFAYGIGGFTVPTDVFKAIYGEDKLPTQHGESRDVHLIAIPATKEE